jgi:hypothetical protein
LLALGTPIGETSNVFWDLELLPDVDGVYIFSQDN